MKQVSAEVIEKRQILGGLSRPKARTILGSWLIWLRCPEIAQEARPGQFVMVRCGQECAVPRPFSIHQISNKGDMALFFAVLEDGRGTKWLSSRHRGDMVELFGPLGNSFSISPGSRNLLLVAGGIGVAPLLFLAYQAIKQAYSVKMLLGASGTFTPSGTPNPSQLYPRELMPPGIDLTTITTSPDGKKGLVSELLPDFTGQADQIFACGPMAMYRDIASRYHSFIKGKSVQISLEVRMGCGLGVCYGCTIKTKSGLRQVCQDGPVFDLDDILWDELSDI